MLIPRAYPVPSPPHFPQSPDFSKVFKPYQASSTLINRPPFLSSCSAKVADITVVSTQDGQRIVCTLASAVPAGTYHVRLVSHGLDPTAPLVTALYKVTVKAAAPRPDPEPIAVSSDGVVKVMSITDSETGDTFTCGNDWIIQGENLKDSVPGWRVEAVHLVTASGANPIGVVIDSTSATECVVHVDPVDKPEVGDYPNAVLMLDMSNTESGSLIAETLELPIHMIAE